MKTQGIWLLVPLAVAAGAAALPFWWNAAARRDEATALTVMTQLRDVQRQLHARAGAYAVSLDTMTDQCDDTAVAVAAAAIQRAAATGYAVTLRPADGASPAGADCRGRPLASDYYLAMTPRRGDTDARLASAARAAGDIHVFFDAVAPRESDIEAGLTTPLAELETFKIP